MKFKDAKRTNFVVGQTVKVVDNNGMVAPLGATAVVTMANHIFMGHDMIDVAWKTNFNNQMGGIYHSYHFESIHKKGQQLIFSFME